MHTSGLRAAGLAIFILGAGGFVALRILFNDHWIALTFYGLLGIMTTLVYLTVAAMVVGGALFLVSFAKVRRGTRS